jgi:hypothetical protein
VEELGAKMRWAFDHREAAQAVGRQARADMVLGFDWDVSVTAMITRLQQIYV